MHRVEVRIKPYLPDARGLGLVKDIHDLGITTVTKVNVVDIYWLDADLTPDKLDLIYIVGTTQNELGGSEYFRSRGFIGNSVPRVNPHRAKELMDRLSTATERGLVRACHDLSEGGIGVALAEMAFADGLGASISLKSVPLGEPMDRDDFILFSESNSRFLVEVASENQAEFEKTMAGISMVNIGQVTGSELLEIYGVNGRKILAASLGELKETWQKPIRW